MYAEGVHIGSSLKRLAERRTDIFGMEETMIGQKIGEEEAAPRPGVQWDGHSGRWVWLEVETTLTVQKGGVVKGTAY